MKILAVITAIGGVFQACIVLPAESFGGQMLQNAQLPVPTGAFRVGRTTVRVIDPSRSEPFATDDMPRALAVDVWYPASDSALPRAPYIDPRAFASAVATTRLRGYLRGAFDAVRTGMVQTHAREAAPFAPASDRSPLLVFSHGGGEAKETYTSQLEELASHGYVVASIAHTYDAVVTVFPDGSSVPFAPSRWPSTQQANPLQLRWWADDIRFVITELPKMRGTTVPFAGRIDTTRIGAFGHSFGGMSAATACQGDRRIRACLNEDGLTTRVPYYLGPDGWGMDQAFMLLRRAGPVGPPAEAELAHMNMTREQAVALAKQMDQWQDATLRSTGGGSYRVILQSERTSHIDFGDLPMLQADESTAIERHLAFLKTVNRQVRTFFDASLRGKTNALPPTTIAQDLVNSVEYFPPRKRAK